MDMLVHQFLFKGVKSFDFRHLANGKFTLIKVCRNVNEFHVVSAVLEVLRARGDEKVDCEVLISAHLKEKGETPLDVSSGEWDDRMKRLAGLLAIVMKIKIDTASVKTGRLKVVEILRAKGGKPGSGLD